jgi:Na+/H+-dicarboxylate symporter
VDKRLTLWILAGMILGVAVGYTVHQNFAPDSTQFEYLTKTFKLLSDIFLNLIKLLVAPLILSTIVVGIAHMGDSSALGRIGFRAITWFIIASFISIGLGLLMVNLFQPGIGAPVDTISNAAAAIGEVKKLDFWEFFLSIFPKNAFEAMATNNILQILVFALFAGIALSALGEKGAPLVRGAEALAEMMLQITHYVMRFAPIAVFGALAAVVSKSGLAILATYLELVTEFYLSLALLWTILLSIGAIFGFLRSFPSLRAQSSPTNKMK